MRGGEGSFVDAVGGGWEGVFFCFCFRFFLKWVVERLGGPEDVGWVNGWVDRRF